MIPIHLTIQGLYSYRQKQEIDFTKLTQAGLFGIFGSVGSGKSTILEAISFALFGESERLNARDHRNYNMMNLKSNELLIDFIFKTGGEQQYRFSVKGKRNSKRFDDVKTFERSAYKQIEGVWTPIEVGSAESITGLNYNNFHRTIIIPQGKFQEFLQLSAKERSAMLRELFNLEKFELFDKAASLDARNNQERAICRDRLSQLGEINPEQETLMQKRLAEIRKELENSQTLLAEKQKSEQALSQLKTLIEKTSEQQSKFNTLKSREMEFSQLEKKIAESEYCLLHFKGLLETFELGERRLKQLSDELKRDQTLSAEYIEQIKILEPQFEKLRAEYEMRNTLQQQTEELTKIVRLLELSADNKTNSERITKGSDVCQSTEAQCIRIKTEKEQLDQELKSLKAKLPDLAELSKVRDWHTNRKALENQLNASTEELVKIQKELTDIQQKALSFWTNDCLSDIPQSSPLEDVILQLKEKTESRKMEIAEIDSRMQHLHVQLRLKEYASELEDGKPCPLCGALSHPDILNAGDVTQTLHAEQQKKSTMEQSVKQMDKISEQLRDLLTHSRLRSEATETLSLKAKQQKGILEAHKKLFIWPGYSDEQKLNRTFTDAANLQQTIKEKESETEKRSKIFESETGKLERYRSELEKIKTQQTINETEIKTLTAQIVLLKIEDYLPQPTSTIKARIEALLKQYQELENRFNQMNNQQTALHRQKDEIGGKIQANTTTLNQEKEVHAQTTEKIRAELAKSAYTNIEAVKNILQQPIDIEREKQKVSDFRKELQGTENQLLLLRKELGDQTYDADAHIKVREDIAQITDALGAKNRELGQLDNELKRLQLNLKQQASLQKDLDRLNQRAEDIQTLKKLFQASGFVNYISTVYLENLCKAANDRFYKLTRQKLSLELADDNSFQIRDFMNEGKLRNVKTLSGGQTFQASLSLALALADSIQKFTTGHENFFFLDEGFGTLDKDSLGIVFDTLKSLRKENRIVGVISHVEDMQQEIETYLKVVNDEHEGSLVMASWE